MGGITTSLKLDAETRARVVELARSRQRSAHALMKEAIDQYLVREERRQAFYAEADAAFAEFEATGLHVSAEAVDAWLEKLEAGEGAASPQAHR